MWTNRESMHHAQLTESVKPVQPECLCDVQSTEAGLGMTQQQASGWIAQQITNQGLIISANEIFLGCLPGYSSSCWGWCGLLNRHLAQVAAEVVRTMAPSQFI